MKKVKNRIYGWLLLSLLLPLAASAQVGDTVSTVTHELSVQQAIDYANKNNLDIKNALIDVLLQKETNRQTTASALPRVSVNGSLTTNLQLQKTLLPGEFFGQPGTLIPVTFGTKYITSGTAELSQILFDGQVFVGLQARRTSIDWANKKVEVTQQMVKANIYKVYYQLAASRTQVDLLDSNINLVKKQQHDADVMYKNGFAEKLDVDRATVALANLETEKAKLLTTINNGYYGLKLLLGIPAAHQVVLTDTLSDQQIRGGILENSNYQYADRKDYQYLELTREFNAYNIRRYKLSKIPTLSIDGSYNKQLQQDEFKFNGNWFTASFVALRLSIPIFNGFATNSKIAAAKLTVRQLDNQIANMKISIDNEVISSRNTLRTSIAAMDYQQKNMELAQEVYRQTKKKYEVGTGSSTELSTAQKDLQEAQTNYINALYDAIIAKVDFLNATGKL
jgi:outer membrane protein TolC